MSTGLRVLILSLALLLVFAASVVILLRVIPGPHTEQDFLVAGGVATFVTMLALFVVLITTWVKAPNVFYRKRNAPEVTERGQPRQDD
jgi:multisubunit Na+/H+ antiporter MnhF subunit